MKHFPVPKGLRRTTFGLAAESNLFETFPCAEGIEHKSPSLHYEVMGFFIALQICQDLIKFSLLIHFISIRRAANRLAKAGPPAFQ